VLNVTDDGRECFDWKGIIILQDEAVHKVGTDGILLGTWVASVAAEADYILDAGTGSGVLALMMAKAFPTSKINAVDIDQKALEMARLNISMAKAENSITLSIENILAHPPSFSPAYDLILCNPPFYRNSILPSSESKTRAKHINVPVKEWVAGLLNRLTGSGQLCIIVPAQGAAQWINTANIMGYYCKHRMDVFSFHTDLHPKRSLLLFGKELIKPILRRMVIYSDENTYTPEYVALTGIKPVK